MKTTNQVLAALCYFSIFFLGFIFPMIIYFIADDDVELKRHAKRALFSHLIPIVMGITVILVSFIQLISITEITNLPAITIVSMVLYGLINLIVIIWNVIQGIKLFKEEQVHTI